VRVLSHLAEVAPDHARGLHLLGVCLDKLGDRDAAVRAYRRAELQRTRVSPAGAARVATFLEPS
jgi:Flp pilus assembly protein TadD